MQAAFQTPLYDVETFPLAVPDALATEIARDAVRFDLGAEFVEVFAHDPVEALVALWGLHGNDEW